MKFGRPTLRYFIQFFTGHGWFKRHRAKIDEDSGQCRFCNSALEDPEHLWSSCRIFDGVRYAIRQICKEDDSMVSFSKPFIWSVSQLIRFFRDPKMVELLTGPGTQQRPLWNCYELVSWIRTCLMMTMKKKKWKLIQTWISPGYRITFPLQTNCQNPKVKLYNEARTVQTVKFHCA